VRLKPTITLHRCVHCTYWEPALTYFGEPTGQGGCHFTVAKNRKGDKLRKCTHYREKQETNPGKSPAVVEDSSHEPLSCNGRKAMDELDELIHYHKDTLFYNSHLMAPSVRYFVESTVKHLKELRRLRNPENDREACDVQDTEEGKL
jgi:hypothetical protein